MGMLWRVEGSYPRDPARVVNDGDELTIVAIVAVGEESMRVSTWRLL
ncbi:hypothetical protein M1O56_04300 [Dehalococcoidia bacterium]|nr:hypothetical protein [Dehalococcoidia bacterium]